MSWDSTEYVSPISSEEGIKHRFRNILFSSILESHTMEKAHKPKTYLLKHLWQLLILVSYCDVC
jgi:hypothetical protein